MPGVNIAVILLAAAVFTAAAAALFLAVWLTALRRGLRRGTREVEERLSGRTSARLDLPCPDKSAEELFGAVNEVLEVRAAEQVAYREKERALREQIANLSHDLRTPLTSILGYLQLLESESLTPEERRAYLAVVTERSRALQSLITSFYDLSRLESGAYPLERERVELRGVLSSLLAAFYGDLESSGLEVCPRLSESVPPVWGDEEGVRRVLSNLLRNAVDHGAGKLTVELYREGEWVVTRLSNGAAGLAPEDAERVFDRTFTSDRNRSGGNAGLGLAIVKALAEAMGGAVSASVAGDVFTVAVRWRAAEKEIAEEE